jgi:hypothetical protein
MKGEKLALLVMRFDVGHTFSPHNYSDVSKPWQPGGHSPKLF